MSDQPKDAQASRRKIEWTLSLLLFVVLLSVMPRVAKDISNQTARIAVSMTPALFYLWTLFRQFRRSDEFIRKLTLEHIAIAAAATVGFGLAYATLEYEGYPKLSAVWVLPVLTGVWAVLHILERLRNR